MLVFLPHASMHKKVRGSPLPAVQSKPSHSLDYCCFFLGFVSGGSGCTQDSVSVLLRSSSSANRARKASSMSFLCVARSPSPDEITSYEIHTHTHTHTHTHKHTHTH